MHDTRCLLRVNRKTETDIKLRDVQIYVDGRHIADLYFGQSVETEMAPGQRELLFDNTLIKRRLKVESKPGQICEIETGNIASGCLSISIALIGVGPYGMFIGEPTYTPIPPE